MMWICLQDTVCMSACVIAEEWILLSICSQDEVMIAAVCIEVQVCVNVQVCPMATAIHHNSQKEGPF